MAIATFPPTIYNKSQGTLVLQVYLKQLIDGEQVIMTFGNQEIYTINNFLDIKNSETTIEISLSELELEAPKLMQGYNTILLTWEGNNYRLILHNQNGCQQNYFDIELDPTLITFHSEFEGTYVLLQTNETSLFYTSNEQIEEITNLYNIRYLNDVFIKEELLENPHPFQELLPNDNNNFYRDFRESNIKYAKKPYLEATPAPLDESPILVEDDKGYLYHQYFFDHKTGVYVSTNTEKFILGRKLSFKLSYDNIDQEYPLLIYIEDEHIDSYELQGSNVFIYLKGWQQDLFYGKEVSITYKLERAYHIEYNENAAFYSYKMTMTDDDTRPVSIIQEGNSASPVRLSTELELNPIVNSQHTGFIYIDKEEQHVQDFRLNVSSSYLIMDGMDSADFIIEAIDQYGNEVLSPYLTVFITDKYNAYHVNYGTLVPIINEDTLKARNTSGRLYFKYKAPLYTPSETGENIFQDTLFLNVYDRKSQLGTQVPIHLKVPLTRPNPLVNQSLEIPPAADIPFEYFARYYERPLPLNHPLSLLDKDNDNFLSREDWLSFKQDLTNISLLESLKQELLDKEVF